MSQTEKSDRVRRVVVALTVVGAVVAALFGSGLLGGTSIKDAAGGAFAADATVLSPAGIAFSIWSVIYLGLFLYALWQLVPAQAAKPLHRTVGYGIAASALLNAVWIACVQAWRIAESFVIIVILLGVLLVVFVRACRRPRRGTIAEIVLVDGTLGLYLGWVTVAAAANLAAWLADIGVSAWTQALGSLEPSPSSEPVLSRCSLRGALAAGHPGWRPAGVWCGSQSDAGPSNLRHPSWRRPRSCSQ
ncbi:tryptophan-rich sensory protein [Microbacterium sp. CH12i]|uniref:tryptophan-rich sensory protein n=1 Tax=Microbacterium sp. CH12i TaxID=1479651 RepID=UPI00068FACFF|nr:tryptophan-rich sensory protein [Microbacterium sp. CH12i]